MSKAEFNVLTASLMAGLFISLSGCQDKGDQHSFESTQIDEIQTETPEQKAVAAPMNLNTQVALSIKDLAQRLDVDPQSIEISNARQVTWRSGALGCPKPGMNYTDALVPGAVIYLQVDDITHAYHAKFAGKPFYCPRERVESPALDESIDHT